MVLNEGKKEINVEIGRRIKAARESAGMTQERFAELIQQGPKNVSAIERGAAGISVSTVKRICEVLSISADTLFTDAPDNSAEAQVLVDRLKHLTPAQFQVATRMFNALLEAFSLRE